MDPSALGQADEPGLDEGVHQKHGVQLARAFSRGTRDHINIRILQTMISGIPYTGPWNQNVISFCDLLGPYA